MLFRNARLLLPDRIQPKGDLRVKENRIVAVGESLPPEPGEAVLDLCGKFLAPGFVDLHVMAHSGETRWRLPRTLSR